MYRSYSDNRVRNEGGLLDNDVIRESVCSHGKVVVFLRVHLRVKKVCGFIKKSFCCCCFLLCVSGAAVCLNPGGCFRSAESSCGGSCCASGKAESSFNVLAAFIESLNQTCF